MSSDGELPGSGNVDKAKAPSWSPASVSCLLDAYGHKFSAGRGCLRSKDWQDVMNAVNRPGPGRDHQPPSPSPSPSPSPFPSTGNPLRTAKQCRDKIDTLKRRYKAEKRRAAAGGPGSVSWPHFERMDAIMGSVAAKPAHAAIPSPLRIQSSCLLRPESDGRPAASGGVDSREHSTGHSSERRSPSPSMPHKSPSPRDSPSIEKQRSSSSTDPVQALADAISGFSEVFARIQAAKMEIFSEMKLELAKADCRRRRKRHAPSSSSSASSTSATE